MTLTPEQAHDAFLHCVGQEPRAADMAMFNVLELDSEQIAHYIWDHWMGEPEDVTVEQIEKFIIDLATDKPRKHGVFLVSSGEMTKKTAREWRDEFKKIGMRAYLVEMRPWAKAPEDEEDK